MTEPRAAALFEQIVEGSEEAVLLLSPGGSAARLAFIYGNGAFEQLTGWAAAEIVGQPLAALRDARTDPADFAHLAAAAEERAPIRLTLLVRGEGRTLWVEIDGRPLAGDEQPYLLRLRDVTDSRRAAAAAREAQERLSALEDLASDGLYYLRVAPDCRLVVTWVAGAFVRLTGYRAEEIEGIGGWVALIEPADLRVVQRRAQRLLAGEQAAVEYRIRTRTGQRLWVRDTGRPEWDEAHELVTGVLCTVQDVSEQRRLEETLLAQQLERRTLAGFTDGLVVKLDGEGRVREVSGQARGELGARLQAGSGRPLTDLIGDELAATWREHAERVVAGWPPVTFELRYPAGNGERYQVMLGAGAGGSILALTRPLSDGAALSAPAVVRAPVLGLEGNRQVRALLNSQAAAAVLLSPAFVVEDLNGAAERLTGWRRASALGQPFVGLLAPGVEHVAVLQDLEQARQGRRIGASEAWISRAGGQEGRIVWSYVPLRDEQGAVIGILAQGEPFTDAVPMLVDEEQRLRAIIDHIADGVITLDALGKILAFSRSAEAIFDYRRDEVIGRSVDLLLVPAPHGGGDAPSRLLARGRLSEARDLLARRKSGEVVPIELAVSEVVYNAEVIHILTVRDVTIRKQTEETIRNLAYHDPLTGLPNRLLFNDRLSQAIERARRNQQVLAVMILDLDRFKLINESLGLASGDRVLRAIGERLSGTVRKSDTVARLGADDFLLLLPGVESAEAAAKVAQKLLDGLSPLLPVDGQELHVSASLGIALYPHDGEDAETLIRNADTALYRAKERSRGSYQFYTFDMNATAFERLVLETQLRRALERDELVLHYQPQVRLDSGAVVGVEALVRWRHPELGLISPAEFIPLAEETGLILQIGRWVLSTACAQVRLWQEQGFPGLRVAVNLSGRQFQQPDLVRTIADVLELSRLDPSDLELELTESSIMQDAEATVAKCEALDRLGIRLSVDDFGTGYSSLAYLKRFPIKALKIDQSFIQDITTDPNDAAIAQAIVALAETLRMRVIAEGVETEAQLQLLRRYHCDEMQGYLFSRPLPPDDLLALLRRGNRLLH